MALRLAEAAHLAVENPHGTQVADFWALRADLTGHLSMEHTRTVLSVMTPRAGDVLFDNHRRPMLTVVDDSTPGVHDTLIAACDPERYRMLGHEGFHESCAANFHTALKDLNLAYPWVPAPFNLFMNVTFDAAGQLKFEAPVSRPGDRVLFRALTDVVVVVSACPQDLVPVNGESMTPRELVLSVP
jgi:uncharacterized protein YcgI (DUF1989 family)